MDYEQILYDKGDHVATITLNRPEVLNVLSTQLMRELNHAFLTFHEDDDAWIAVLRAAGDRAFCAGADLKDVAAGTFNVDQGALPNFYRGTLIPVKPVVGVVQGFALGGGCELALACDLLLVAEEARMGLVEVLNGIKPGPGTPRLLRKLPHNVAMEYLITGKQWSAQEALAWGLANRVVPRAQLDNALAELLDRLRAAAPLAVRAVKERALRGDGLPLASALAFGAPRGLAGTEDAKEGPRAFAEKRKPVWKGK
jgi:enoyl-CoA hydratase/carnithine racemase